MLQCVEAKIRALLDQPRAVGTEKLTAVGGYRARAGDHRIVYEIDDRMRTVTVARVRHRREVYRKLR